MFKLLLGILVLIVSVATAVVLPRVNSRMKRLPILIGGVILAGVLICLSFVVTLNPGEVGVAYQLSGKKTDVTVGYNFIPPWARINKWNATIQVFTFSQGDANDDIYGAQTNEKDYIEVVSTMSIRIDTNRMDEYISLYGTEELSSTRIQQMLKTISREAIESSINVKSTADVMSGKKLVSEEANAYLATVLKDLPLELISFTIDDLVAPESYENAIKEQAQLRMDKEKAVLQQQINEQQALADKAKADGEATVMQTRANAEAEVKRIEAESAAAIATIEANNQAEIKRIQAEAEANVRRTQAEAEANEITTKANAEAEAIVAQGEAEAKAIAAQGEAYKQNPQLIELEMAEINAATEKTWAEKWSGFSFEGMSGFNFANLTEILKGIIPSSTKTVNNTDENEHDNTVTMNWGK